jgi:hypothetical protein
MAGGTPQNQREPKVNEAPRWLVLKAQHSENKSFIVNGLPLGSFTTKISH